MMPSGGTRPQSPYGRYALTSTNTRPFNTATRMKLHLCGVLRVLMYSARETISSGGSILSNMLMLRSISCRTCGGKMWPVGGTHVRTKHTFAKFSFRLGSPLEFALDRVFARLVAIFSICRSNSRSRHVPSLLIAAHFDIAAFFFSASSTFVADSGTSALPSGGSFFIHLFGAYDATHNGANPKVGQCRTWALS